MYKEQLVTFEKDVDGNIMWSLTSTLVDDVDNEKDE
jgi:hypothetical protein